MEIKQTILKPFGSREDSGTNGSLWTMGGGGGVIGSNLPETSTPVYGPTTDWYSKDSGPDGTLIRIGCPLVVYAPSEWDAIVAAPSNYNVVVTGGTAAGTYPVNTGSIFSIYSAMMGEKFLTFNPGAGGALGIPAGLKGATTSDPYNTSGLTPDAGIISIVPK